jgi:hypothetical protein
MYRVKGYSINQYNSRNMAFAQFSDRDKLDKWVGEFLKEPGRKVIIEIHEETWQQKTLRHSRKHWRKLKEACS